MSIKGNPFSCFECERRQGESAGDSRRAPVSELLVICPLCVCLGGCGPGEGTLDRSIPAAGAGFCSSQIPILSLGPDFDIIPGY